MKKLIVLDEKDIQKVLAEKFNCDPCHVSITAEKSWAGHGPTEHEIHTIKATIRQEETLC